MRNFANRYRSNYERPALLSEGEVLRRVITSIKTLKALPDAERRHLLSGTRAAWPQPLVEWADLLARAEITDDDFEPPEKYQPKRSEISDALIAAEWFAKLALLPENIDEFEARVAIYRLGKSKSVQVDDQKILSWVAFGWSLKSIGQRIGMNETQAERRYYEIIRNLARCANGQARLIDPATRKRKREYSEARNAGCGAEG